MSTVGGGVLLPGELLKIHTASNSSLRWTDGKGYQDITDLITKIKTVTFKNSIIYNEWLMVVIEKVVKKRKVKKPIFWYKIDFKKIGIFFEKSGFVTFETLSLSNFMQRIGKILRAVFEKND